MLILALDTTTRAGSVAVTRDDEVLAVVDGDAARTHGERLPGEIEQVLTAAGIQIGHVQLLVVASGPGAFTGLRIGLAAIQGLAMVTGAPVVGVSALDALATIAWPALEPGETSVVTWMDAARGEVFSAEFRTTEEFSTQRSETADARDAPLLTPIDDPVVAAPAAIFATLDRARAPAIVFVGDGARRYEADITAWSRGAGRVLAQPAALAPALARIGRLYAARGAAGPPHALQPLYVRRPDVEMERSRRS